MDTEEISGSPEREDAEFSELMKSTTLSTELQNSISGAFPSEEHARELLATVVAYLNCFGTFLNLEGLDAVTIADDYVRALAQVERGFVPQQAPTPTKDEFGSGYAMCLPVVRNGKLKSHIVFNTAIVQPLMDDKNPYMETSLHYLCHEAAHAHDQAAQNEAFPGVYVKPYEDFRHMALLETAKGAWEEYIAERLSANVGKMDDFESTLCSMLNTARERGNASIDQFYNVHHDVVKTARELISIYGALFTRSSYLVGYVHGIGKTVQEVAPELHALIQQTTWYTPLFNAYVSCLTELYESYGKWSGIQVFDKFKEVVESLFVRGGMSITKEPDGNYFIGLHRK